MEEKRDWIERIFGKKGILYVWVDSIIQKWFKNLVTILLLIILAIILSHGLKSNWIDQSFGIELLFFIVGVVLGKFMEKLIK